MSSPTDHAASPDDLRDAARACGPRAIATLLAVLRGAGAASPAARLAAANVIIDYGGGRPARGLSSRTRDERRLFEAAERNAREILARGPARPR